MTHMAHLALKLDQAAYREQFGIRTATLDELERMPPIVRQHYAWWARTPFGENWRSAGPHPTCIGIYPYQEIRLAVAPGAICQLRPWQPDPRPEPQPEPQPESQPNAEKASVRKDLLFRPKVWQLSVLVFCVYAATLLTQLGLHGYLLCFFAYSPGDALLLVHIASVFTMALFSPLIVPTLVVRWAESDKTFLGWVRQEFDALDQPDDQLP